MSPTHHIPDEWLVAYASGRCSAAEEVLTATHLTLCPQCRDHLALAETAAAAALVEVSPVALDPSGLDALMARLDEPEPKPPPVPSTDPVLPWPILRFTGPIRDLNWSWLAPHVVGVDLPQATEGLPMRLIKMKAGSYMPHKHTGNEASVLLAGGWSDSTGDYRRGDAGFYGPETGDHDQRIHDDEDCIALVLNDERAKVEGVLASRIAHWLFKI